MTIERKRHIAIILKELNLYPHYSKAENFIRGAIWIASWVVGIVVNQSSDSRALGGAYFMFSITLLCEFAPRSKNQRFAQLIHGAFCCLTFVLFILSLFLVFGSSDEVDIRFLSSLKTIGWIIAGVLIAEVLLALTEVQKLFCAEEAEANLEIEAKREIDRNKFYDSLNGKQNKGE